MFSPTDLDAAIKSTFAGANDIPPDKTRALLTAVDQDGVKLILAQRLPDGWQMKGYVDEPWSGGLQYGVTLEKTWILVALLVLFWPCPILAQTQITPTSILTWDQQAATLATAQGYTYKVYVDANTTGVTVTPVTCVTGTGTFAATCSSGYPTLTAGPHTLTVTATNAVGESPKSTVLSVTMVIPQPPSAPQNPRVGGAGGGGPPVVSNLVPLPAGFVAYPRSAFHRVVPANPKQVPALESKLQAYFSNTSDTSTNWYTLATNAVSGCTDQSNGKCDGLGDWPLWAATMSDVPVTFTCTMANDGCYDHDKLVPTFSVTGFIPANARPGCTDAKDIPPFGSCGDNNWAILLPDGSSMMLYQCNPIPWPFTAGQVISSSSCGGMAHASLSADQGNPNSVTSGPPSELESVYVNQFQSDTIDHAIEAPVSCVDGTYNGTSAGGGLGYVYPASSTTFPCPAGLGVPAGTHYWLALTPTQIEAAVTAGQLPSGYSAIYHALNKYGGFVIDTAGQSTPFFPRGPHLESALPWVTNGQGNPWIGGLFAAKRATLGTTATGTPVWNFVDGAFWNKLLNPALPCNPHCLVVLDPCLAQGTC